MLPSTINQLFIYSKTGSYFLATNDKSPYALGQKGINFNKPSFWTKKNTFKDRLMQIFKHI